MIHFGCLRPAEIPAFWAAASRILRKARRGKVNIYTVEDYFQPLMRGQMQLWLAIADKEPVGAVLTQIHAGSNMSVCGVQELAGEKLPEWAKEADAAICKFARDNGCDAMEYVGREGFTRIFPDLTEDGRVYIRMLK